MALNQGLARVMARFKHRVRVESLRGISQTKLGEDPSRQAKEGKSQRSLSDSQGVLSESLRIGFLDTAAFWSLSMPMDGTPGLTVRISVRVRVRVSDGSP